MGRELTRKEKAAIRSLVVKWCANYDREYRCLPLECECYIHNHIYYNPISLDYTRKFRDFWRSAGALRRLSDRVCLENDLSVIQHLKLHSKGRFLHYGQWIGGRPPSAQQRVRQAIVAALEQKPADFAAFLWLMEESGFAVKHGRGGVISFLAPGQDKHFVKR